jgi:branched-chain amino acid transport system substrate-binding protein
MEMTITRAIPPSAHPIRIGYGLSLTGALGANGQSARLAHRIWQDDVNRRGGLLGRPVQLICHDDQTDAALVPGIYTRLQDIDKVDLVVGGYGTNSLVPAMPLIIERGRFFVGLMGLGVNAQAYVNYFAMIPTGPTPSATLTEGFFALAAAQTPRPATVALLCADAEFARNPVIGARENARKHGMRIVQESLYPLSTKDFGPIVDELKALDPDVLFLCSYLHDSVGLVRAIHERGLRPRMVGSAMIGPQSASVKTALGPLLNGFVNYDYWVPAPTMMFPGVAELIGQYQAQAFAAGVDPLGHYMAPLAYAQMQVVEQAITATGGLDDALLAAHARRAVFKTVVGDVRFGERGEWATPRVLQVQFQHVKSDDIAEFRDDGVEVVVWPAEFASGSLIYPYAAALK